MAAYINGKLVRHCKKCGIRSNVIDFKQQKDTKSGKIYTHNVCIPCFKERASILTRKRYKKNRKELIKKSREWNIKNRERYNARRRTKNKFFNGCTDNFYLTEIV